MVRYVAGLSWAYLLTLAEVVAIVMSLGGRSTWNAQGLVILAVQVIAGTTLVATPARTSRSDHRQLLTRFAIIPQQ